MVAVVLLSLLAATVFGTSVALQSYEAGTTDSRSSLRPSLLIDLAQRPLWLIGLVGDIGGFALQTAALALGSLLIVQPILTLGLVAALMVSARLTKRRLTGWEWRAVGGVVVGLIVFYLAAQPTPHSEGVASAAAWATAAAIVGAILMISLSVGRRRDLTARAVLFGLAAGCAEAVMAVISKAFGDRLGDGVWHTFTSWEPYVLIVWGIVTLIIVQSAYQLDRSTVTLPVITVAEPVIAMTVGLALFRERPQLGVASIVLAVAGLGWTLRSLVVLARDPALSPTVGDGHR